ncbi:Membrane protein TerC, possibly involved in tellurium resistance [Nitrosomonas eutropha]|uniref:Membrane protein TerC, possibly involved in tellurium resistance n=1 Tax=Nitrosomonas eutropha TaxID=916 RepID=A0A1I7J470_9PROT|nr:TerC family protein [Nitrosomonas eutropha]SFU79985.1 Membrane protein TerC, possibly involved in tellurium resistance [Nitrosomonas eutropha]
MFFEWVVDPAAWAGLATLVILEIVLGIDNLVFIAILADKLPLNQRERARIVGLSLALVMRLILLASISWVITLTTPLLTVFDIELSWRNIILLFGGLFLLFKGTMELHERLEGHSGQKEGKHVHAVFWQVIVQIIVLDAVFSLDSMITAVGMVEHLAVMMIAVIIAVAVMMISSGPLMTFVSKHPTVVILCLGFLMMIGFSLVIEGFNYHVPKGYLYAAISFSILIEAFNQLARHNKEKFITTGDLRDRTAEAVLRLLGGKGGEVGLGETAEVIAQQVAKNDLFAREEKEMIEGVLMLAERPAMSIMTPRTDIDWLDLENTNEMIRLKIIDSGHSRFLLSRGSVDEFVGAAFAKDLLRDILEEGKINLEKSLRHPIVVHERVPVIKLMEQLRDQSLQLAVIVEEYGSVEGIVTPADILEAIAGEFLDADEEKMVVEQQVDGSWLMDGWISIRKVSNLLEYDLVDDAERYSTLGGYLLWQLGYIPGAGEQITVDDLIFEIVSVNRHNIGKVRVYRVQSESE